VLLGELLDIDLQVSTQSVDQAASKAQLLLYYILRFCSQLFYLFGREHWEGNITLSPNVAIYLRIDITGNIPARANTLPDSKLCPTQAPHSLQHIAALSAVKARSLFSFHYLYQRARYKIVS
jgi:hypothetical protein